MSASIMLGAPQPFKPTLVSDYFFDDPPSPLPYSLVDLNISSSPDVDSPRSHRNQYEHHDTKGDVLMEHDSLEMPSPMRVVPPVASSLVPTVDSSSASKAVPPQLVGADIDQAAPGVGSPTQIISHFGTNDARVATAVHELIGAPQLPDDATPPLPPQRKNSASTTTTCATSAPSTAPNSSPNSPTSSSDQRSSSTSSAAHTPSPPPLTLPAQAAATANPTPPTTEPAGICPPAPSSSCSSAADGRIVVPAAASHLAPVVVPPHGHTQPPHRHQHQHQHQHHARHEHHTHHHHSSATHGHLVPPPPARHARHPSGDVAGVEYVGPFILGPVLGRGCTGTVRLGTHKHTKFQVAFKIIDKVHLQTDPKLWQKVKREIVILKLIEHKNVLKLYDVLETENRLYLVLEHVKGGELFDYIVSKGRLDRHESLRIAAQIVMGLEHCHRHSICHRDLKPENLLLDESHNIKICVAHGTEVLLASGDVIRAEQLDADLHQLVSPNGRRLAIEHLDASGHSRIMYTIRPTDSSAFIAHSVTPHHRVAFRRWATEKQAWVEQIEPAQVLFARFASMSAHDRHANYRLYKPRQPIHLGSDNDCWLATAAADVTRAHGILLSPSAMSIGVELLSWLLGVCALDGCARPASDAMVRRMADAQHLFGGQHVLDEIFARIGADSYDQIISHAVLGRMMMESIRTRRAFISGIFDAAGQIKSDRTGITITASTNATQDVDSDRLCRFMRLLGLSVMYDVGVSSWSIRSSVNLKESLSFSAHAGWVDRLTAFDLNEEDELLQSPFDIAVADETVSRNFVSFQVSGGLYLLADLCVTHNCDFGMAQLMKKDGILKTSCGSPHYAAPEIISGDEYNAHSTDVWSIGVILYALITGSLPFDHDNIPTLLAMVTKGHYTTPSHVPADIAHLISRMLTVDPAKRISLPEVRNHICFKGKNYFSHPVSAATDSNRTKIFSGPTSHFTGGAAYAHKRHKLSGDRLTTNNALDGSDDEADHSWRKTSTKGLMHHSIDGDESGVTRADHPSSQRHSHPHPHSHSYRVVDDDVIDEAVLNDLESLGLGPRDGNRDELRKRIRGVDNKEPSLEQVFYKLLRQRKVDRLAQLTLLSPKVSPIQTRRISRHHSSSHHHSTRASESQPSTGVPPSMHATPLMVSSVPNSHAVSQVSSPTNATIDMSHILQELTLPPPYSRNDQNEMADAPADATMNEAQSTNTSTHASTGTSMYKSTQSSQTVVQQSSIFGTATAFATTLFDLTINKPATPMSDAQPTVPTPALTPTPATAASGIGGVSPADSISGPPPMQHCYSDGHVPQSIMEHEATASYYGPPALQLTVTQPQPHTIDQPASPTSSSGSMSRDHTGPSTPTNGMAESYQYMRSAYDSSASPAMQPTSLSAHVSPTAAVTQRILFQRRMSTPATEYSTTARRLFADDSMSMSSAQQFALDDYARRMDDGPTSENMDLDSVELAHIPTNHSASVPMHPSPYVASPPLLSLPRVAPHIHVPTNGDSSGSDHEAKEDRESASAVHRPRAYSQDETDMMPHRHHHPTDRIASNVHTPMLTPKSASHAADDNDRDLPSYTTSPRFHRVTFQDSSSSASSSSASTGVGKGPLHSLRQSDRQPPPSPVAKKSWFSAVFGTAHFSIFDRLKGKRANANPIATGAAPTHNTPSPISSPSRFIPHGIHTKRATLTLANDLTKLFGSIGVQFVHHGSYRFGASYAGATNPPEFQVPPMPPSQMPLMHRALSTPDERDNSNARDRPRSQSITHGSMSPQPTHHTQPNAFLPSTPKPTPTRTLNQPFVPSVIQYPTSPAPSTPRSDAPTFDRTESSSSSNSSVGVRDQAPDAAGASPSTGAVSSSCPGSLPVSSPVVPRVRSSAPSQLFGPHAVRFSVEICELPGDVRAVQITRKSGDESTFHRIEQFVREQMHLE